MNDADSTKLKRVLAEVMQSYFKHHELGARIKSVSVEWITLNVACDSRRVEVYPNVTVEFLP